MRRRALCLGLLVAAPALLVPGIAFASPVEIEVVLSTPRTQVGRGVYLQVVVKAEGEGEPSDPEFPDLPGLEITEQGTSLQSSMSFGTGQRMLRQVDKTHEYMLLPTQPGKYALDITVSAGGQRIKPARIPVLEVLGDATDAAPAQAARADARPTVADDEVFLWPIVAKERVYVGEPLLYQLEIWERASGEVQLRSMPSFDDFWVEELEAGRRRRDVVEGVPYRVHPLLERVLFPQKAGKLTIGGGEVVVTPHGGLGLLRPRRSQPPYSVAGVPLVIEVEPLPAEGQPPDFPTNNVGRFAIQAAVDRTEVAQGEAFTLTVTIEGTGNLRFVDPGEWPELPGMRRYDPKEEFTLTLTEGDIGGVRRYEFLIVAEEAGDLEIPAHTVAYFDPGRGAYALAQSSPIRIRVEADPNARPSTDAGLEDVGTEEQDELLADVFMSDALPRAHVQPPWLTPIRWTTGVLAVPTMLAAGAAGRAIHRRLTGDAASRARSEKAAQRRRLVDRAKRAVGSGEGFFPAVAALVHGVAVEFAGAQAVGLPRDRLLGMLREQGIAEIDVDKLRTLLDTCDSARFGAGGSDAASRRDLLHEALELVDAPAWKGGAG